MSENNELQARLTDIEPELAEPRQQLAEMRPLQHNTLEQVIPQGQRLAFWANWDTSDLRGKAMVTQCFGDADLPVSKVLGQTIYVTHLLVHPVQIVQPDDGEIVDATRVVLVLKDGQTVAAVSGGIVKSVQLICMLCGQGPWEDGLPLVVKQVETRSGRRTYNLQLDPKGLKPGKKGGK